MADKDARKSKSRMYSKLPIRAKLLVLHGIYFVCVVAMLCVAIIYLMKYTDISSSEIRIVIIIIAIGIIVAAILVAIYSESLKSAIIHPVRKIEDALRRLSKGDINVSFDHYNQDEMGSLVDSLNLVVQSIRYETDVLTRIAEGDYTEHVELRSEEDEMFMVLNQIVETINSFIVDIRNLSAQISSAADQVAYSSQNLAHGASTQTTSVNSVSGSISNVSELAVDNSGMASSMMTQMDSNARIVQDILNDMQSMKSAMAEIANSAEKVTHVTKIIDDISFQTNLLALNAAVEAARAGQQGKGFAVVADEVRSLASKSAAAAKETNVLIQSSIESVERGNVIVDTTDQRTLKLHEVLILNKQATAELSEKANTQFNTINEINKDMMQFTDVIHANAAMAEQSSASAEELSAQVDYLNDRLKHFHVKE